MKYVVMETLDHPLNILFVYLGPPARAVRNWKTMCCGTSLKPWVMHRSNDLMIQKKARNLQPPMLRRYLYLKNNPTDIIIFNGQMKPSQKFTLMKAFWAVRPNIQISTRRFDSCHFFPSRQNDGSQAPHKWQAWAPDLRAWAWCSPVSGMGSKVLGETNTELHKRHWKRKPNGSAMN